MCRKLARKVPPLVLGSAILFYARVLRDGAIGPARFSFLFPLEGPAAASEAALEGPSNGGGDGGMLAGAIEGRLNPIEGAIEPRSKGV
jgi:hypothetical protein